MKNYFCLQLKKVIGHTPAVLCVSVLLLVCMAVGAIGAVKILLGSEEYSLFRVGLCGDTDGEYIELGLSAVKTIDDTRFSMEFVTLDESDARTALAKGDISAYVVLPDDFIENAMMGVMEPVVYVTTPGQGGVVTMFKNEITALITDLVVYSQKGTYGIYDALCDNGASETAYEHMNDISIKYAELVFDRSDVYEYRELGISSGLSGAEYYVCALSVLMLFLLGIAFACAYIRGDRSICRLLLSRGYTEGVQLSCEYAAHLISMLAFSFIIFFLALGGMAVTNTELVDTVGYENILGVLIRLSAVVVMISAFNIMIFEMFDDLVSGVLAHFFISLCMCYVSGCMYPIYSLPKILQSVSALLPAGIAREYIGGAFTYESCTSQLFLMAFYSVLFFLVAYALRTAKTRFRVG